MVLQLALPCMNFYSFFLELEGVELLDCVAGHCAHPVEENLELLETLPHLKCWET